MLVLSDAGRLVDVTVTRDASGITDLEIQSRTRLCAWGGQALESYLADSEGLARRSNGSLCISFEIIPRVHCYAEPGAPAQPLHRHGDFKNLVKNRALEALAVDDQDRLIALPERPNADGVFPIYLLLVTV